jgi:hypothetical protein
MALRRLENDPVTAGRPQRFSIAMPVYFRPLEEITWQEGRVENISRSGILFRAAQPVEVTTRVELRFDLPAEVGGEPGAHVVCIGEITRVIPPPTADEQPILAASITDYRFVRGAADDAD